jgi:hypothetical protein
MNGEEKKNLNGSLERGEKKKKVVCEFAILKVNIFHYRRTNKS